MLSRRNAYLCFIVLGLGVLLTACLSYIEVDAGAPELDKQYVLTEPLVLSAVKMTLPTFWRPLKVSPYAMTRPYFRVLKRSAGALAPEITDRGTIRRNSGVQVKKLFTFHNTDGSAKKAEVQFTDPTGRQTTAYATWSDIQLKLKEK